LITYNYSLDQLSKQSRKTTKDLFTLEYVRKMDSFISPDVRNMADSDGIQFGSFELAKSKGGRKLTLLGSDYCHANARHWSIGWRPEFFFAPKLKNKSTTAARTRVLTVLTFLTLDLPSISGPELVRSLAVTSCPKAIDQPQRNGQDFGAAVGELPTRCAGANLWDGGKFTNPKIHQIVGGNKNHVDSTHSCKMAWVGDCEWVSDKPTLFQSCMFQRWQTLGYFGFLGPFRAETRHG